jgi:hypothetical protein
VRTYLVNSFSHAGKLCYFVFLWSLKSFILCDIWKLHLTPGWSSRKEILSQEWIDFLTWELCLPSTLWLGLWIYPEMTTLCVLHPDLHHESRVQWDVGNRVRIQGAGTELTFSMRLIQAVPGRASRTWEEIDGTKCRMTCGAADHCLFMQHHWIEDWMTQEKWRSH